MGFIDFQYIDLVVRALFGIDPDDLIFDVPVGVGAAKAIELIFEIFIAELFMAEDTEVFHGFMREFGRWLEIYAAHEKITNFASLSAISSFSENWNLIITVSYRLLPLVSQR